MITTLLLIIFYNFIWLVMQALPTSQGLPESITSAISTIIGYVNGFSFILNTPVLFTVLGLTLAFEVTMLTARFTVWLLHFIRGN